MNTSASKEILVKSGEIRSSEIENEFLRKDGNNFIKVSSDDFQLREYLKNNQINLLNIPSRSPPFTHGENRLVLRESTMSREKTTTIRMNRMSLISFDANRFPQPSL